jgi:hypothetical protein
VVFGRVRVVGDGQIVVEVVRALLAEVLSTPSGCSLYRHGHIFSGEGV